MADAPSRPELAAVLVKLRRRVDDHFDAAVARTPTDFACRDGCSTCCHQRISVFAIEADAIRDALAELAVRDPELRARVRAQADAPAAQRHCALLVDDRCSIYPQRPLICRSHGLPVVADDRTPDKVDACPLNFRDTAPPPASRLRLAAVNQPLAVLTELWSPRAPRVPLTELARAADRALEGPLHFPVDALPPLK